MCFLSQRLWVFMHEEVSSHTFHEYCSVLMTCIQNIFMIFQDKKLLPEQHHGQHVSHSYLVIILFRNTFLDNHDAHKRSNVFWLSTAFIKHSGFSNPVWRSGDNYVWCMTERAARSMESNLGFDDVSSFSDLWNCFIQYCLTKALSWTIALWRWTDANRVHT